jgi:hypothetical protein
MGRANPDLDSEHIKKEYEYIKNIIKKEPRKKDAEEVLKAQTAWKMYEECLAEVNFLLCEFCRIISAGSIPKLME